MVTPITDVGHSVGQLPPYFRPADTLVQPYQLSCGGCRSMCHGVNDPCPQRFS